MLDTALPGTALPGTAASRSLCVMQIIPRLGQGGAEQGVVDIAQGLNQAGHSAIVISQSGEESEKRTRLAAFGAEHIQLPVASKNPALWPWLARYVARIARQKGCDIIHVRSRAPAWWAFHAARLAGCRFVTTFHGTYTIPDGPAGFFKRRYNAILTKGDLVIAISHFIANHIINHYPTPWGKIRIIARGIDEQRFDPNQVDAARIARQRSAWQLDHHTQNRLRPVILLPGRLTRWKGQMLMIEALARLPRPRPLCVLVGASQGRGRYLQELHQLAQVKGVAEDVRIWQAADDLPAAMMIADLIVSASTDPEAFGRVSAEAMMMGKPIIAPAHGGACEQIDHLKTGFLFQPGSAASLAAGLETMLHLSAPARTAITSHARAKALQQFTCGQMQQKTMRVYDEVMRTRRIIKPDHAFQNA